MYLVCSGRGNNTHAYTHSVLDGHHVFLNLQTHKFYCIPDNYEIIDSSLEDIIVCILHLKSCLIFGNRSHVFFQVIMFIYIKYSGVYLLNFEKR